MGPLLVIVTYEAAVKQCADRELIYGESSRSLSLLADGGLPNQETRIEADRMLQAQRLPGRLHKA